MADIQLFREKIRAAKDYPLNLVGVNKHGDYLSKLAGQLADNQTRLFSPEGSAKVDLLERQHVDRGEQRMRCVVSNTDLDISMSTGPAYQPAGLAGMAPQRSR